MTSFGETLKPAQVRALRFGLLENDRVIEHINGLEHSYVTEETEVIVAARHNCIFLTMRSETAGCALVHKVDRRYLKRLLSEYDAAEKTLKLLRRYLPVEGAKLAVRNTFVADGGEA